VAVVAAATVLLIVAVTWAQAADVGVVHAVIVGRAGVPATTALLDAAATTDRTDLLVTFYDLGAPPSPALPELPSSVKPLLADARARGVAAAYVCTESQCSLPLVDPRLLRQTIRRFALPH